MYLNKSTGSILKMKGNKILPFVFQLTLILGVAAFFQDLLYDYLQVKTNSFHLIYCYLFNYVLTLLFYFTLIYFKERKAGQLGFVFLFSSLIKFVLFFIILAPILNFEGSVRSVTFFSFFVPYATSLFLEIFYIIRLLNK